MIEYKYMTDTVCIYNKICDTNAVCNDMWYRIAKKFIRFAKTEGI